MDWEKDKCYVCGSSILKTHVCGGYKLKTNSVDVDELLQKVKESFDSPMGTIMYNIMKDIIQEIMNGKN